MNPQKAKISLVVSTLGRSAELSRLFNSLAQQDYDSFDVIIVDQNSDDRLAKLCNDKWPFDVRWIRVPQERGLSRGRNIGWRVATGAFILFPDDDCWYPPWFLSRAAQLLSTKNADIVAGRAADENGRDINGRYSQVAHAINRANVWISGIEWVMLFKRSALDAVGGFDENVGVGAATPWQACEGQDILLKALEKCLACQFEPMLFGYHDLFDAMPPKSMQKKGRAYGRGLGHVLRTHRYGVFAAGWWVSRPLARLIISVFKGDFDRAVYYFNVSLGRLEGYLGRIVEFGS